MVAKKWMLYFTIGAAVSGTAVRADRLSAAGVSLGGLTANHDPTVPEDPGIGDPILGEDPDIGMDPVGEDPFGEDPIVGEGGDHGHHGGHGYGGGPQGPDDQFEIPPLIGGGVIDLLGGQGHRPKACFARNLRGQIFEAMDVREHRAQMRAMAACERVSHHCIPLGCQRLL